MGIAKWAMPTVLILSLPCIASPIGSMMELIVVNPMIYSPSGARKEFLKFEALDNQNFIQL